MLDFSDAPFITEEQSYVISPLPDDTPELRRYLVDTLALWLPRMLPGGITRHGEFLVGSTAGDAGRSLRVSLTGERRGLWVDHATGEGGDGFALLQSCLGTDFRGAVRVVREMMGNIKMTPMTIKDIQTRPPSNATDTMNRIQNILSHTEARPDIAISYLKSRGLSFDPQSLPVNIKSHTSLFHPHGGSHPAMVCAVRDINGRVIGLHRTYLELRPGVGYVKSSRAKPVRAMLGVCSGGSVRLSAKESSTLGLCEGIETGLSVSTQTRVSMPLWACLSTSGLRAIEIPEHVTNVVIFADFDEPLKDGRFKGQRPGTLAAEECADRLITNGRSVEIVYPSAGFCDFNDVLMEQGQC